MAKGSTKGSSLSPLKLVAGVRMFLLARTGRRSIGALAGFQALASGLQLLYWIIMPSTTDLAADWMNRAWIHQTFILPCFLGGILGVVVCVTCNVRLCRLYFFWLPIAFLSPVPCTTTFWSMKCDCSNYYQCSALASFAKYKGFQYVNPHPIPDDAEKFGQPSIPWETPPGMEAMDSSLVQQFSITSLLNSWGSAKKGSRESNQNGSSLQSFDVVSIDGDVAHGHYSDARRARQIYRKPSVATPSGLATSVGFLQQQEGATGRKGMQHQSKLTKKTDMQNLVSSLRNAAASTVHGEVNKLQSNSTIAFFDDAGPSLDYDPRVLYRMRNPREVVHMLRQDPKSDGTEAVNKEICQSHQLDKDDVFWQKAWLCRDPNVAPGNTTTRCDDQMEPGCKCDPKIDQALLACAKNPICGVLKLIFTRNAGVSWNLTVCILEAPTYISGYTQKKPKNGNVVDSNDIVEVAKDANCQIEDCTLYFEREMTRSLDERATSKVNAIMLEKQKKMSRQDWQEYISKQQSDECTCEANGNDAEDRSCRAYLPPDSDPMAEAESAIQFWCPVTQKDKRICEAEYNIKDFKKDGTKYWSTQICHVAGCKCSVGLALRVWDADVNKVRKAHLQAASSEGNGEPLIGHKCDHWFKDDELPWCVVGFDSVCGDREGHTIPSTGVKIYTSRVPCTKHMTQNVADKAGQTCRIMQMAMLSLDSLRYLIAIPMFYMVLAFLMTRCGDQDTMNDGGAGRAFDVSDSGNGAELDFFSDDDDDLDLDESEEGSGSEGRGTGKGGSDSGGEVDFSESEEEPAPKKKKKK